MKWITFGVAIMAVYGVVRAAPPNENVVKSCLQAQSAVPSVAIEVINGEEVTQEDDYADGFNAIYLFKYHDWDVGYAEKKSDQALIYLGKLYRLSKAESLENNHGVKPGAFNPTLTEWSVIKNRYQKYFCASFNFAGLGQSGSFQRVRGGYLLNTKTKNLYFVVRNIMQ